MTVAWSGLSVGRRVVIRVALLAPVATAGGSTPLWWWVAGAVTLAAVAAGLIRVRRRRLTGTTR
ncbi:hypothetical protein AB0J90_17355 [Micromonospora sp. NPDC049523]|uniref:hypothetical protein n=1 Tax=Micromonospora sp. NPDC049523 TaxID=3155921 RepID=UPI003440F6C0